MNLPRFGLLAIFSLLAFQVPAANAVEKRYHYTRPTAEFGRPLQVLVVRGMFFDKPYDTMLTEEEMKYGLQSMALYYNDSSWNAVEFEYTFTPVVTLPSDCVSWYCSADTIKTYLIQLATNIGFTYCQGACSADPARVGDYDQLIMVFNHHNAGFVWSGMGIVGNGVTWILKPYFDAPTLEHEVGHNFGILHGESANWRRANGFNAITHPGFSRMEGGGSVFVDNEGSRYKDNGHFGLCEKLWNGWINRTNIVRIHPDGPSDTCPDCEADGSYKIWAFDRPDVTPFDGKIMGLELEYSPNKLLHIYYRSAQVKGAVVAYCEISPNPGLDAGATMTTFTEDVQGQDSKMDNAGIMQGTTWVGTPNYAVRQNSQNDVSLVPVVTVNTETDWSPCTADRICPPGHDVSITVDFSFKSVENGHPAVDFTQRTDAANAGTGLSSASKTLLRVTDGSDMNMKGAGGQGTFEFNFCAEFQASVYLYDSYPYSAMQMGAPLGYNSFATFRSAPFLCCANNIDANNNVMPLIANGYKAVKVIQESGGHLNLAEIVVTKVGGGSCMDNSKCYAFNHNRINGLVTTGGAWTTAGSDGSERFLNDGDFTTNAHSGDPAGPGFFAVCIFEDVCAIDEVKIYTPASAFNFPNRVERYSVELWAFAEAVAFTSPGTDGSRPTPGVAITPSSSPALVGLLDTYDILATDQVPDANSNTRYYGYSPTVAFPKNVECGFTGVPASSTFTFVSGQAFILINKDSGSGEVSWSLSATRSTCVTGAAATTAGGCVACPERLLTFTGDVSVCPGVATLVSLGKAASCALIHMAPEGGKASAAEGFFALNTSTKNGHPYYLAGDKMLYRWPGEAKWVITTVANETVILAQSNGDGLQPMTATDALASSNSAGVYGIRAVKVSQQKNDALNIAEIEIFSRDEVPVNLAIDQATCYSGPTVGYWYNGNRETTETPQLNDGNLATSSESGDDNLAAYAICVLDQVYDVSKVFIQPRSGQWPRSNHLKVEFWSDFVPAGDLSSTYATDADLGDLLYSVIGDFSPGNGWYTAMPIEICTNPIKGPGGGDAAEPICASDAETRGNFVTTLCPGLQALLDDGTCSVVPCSVRGDIIQCPGSEEADILARC